MLPNTEGALARAEDNYENKTENEMEKVYAAVYHAASGYDIPADQ